MTMLMLINNFLTAGFRTMFLVVILVKRKNASRKRLEARDMGRFTIERLLIKSRNEPQTSRGRL